MNKRQKRTAAARVYAAVDVGKLRLDATVDGRRVKGFDNTAAGIRRLARHAAKAGVDVVVCEASGGYERRMLDMLAKAGIATHRAHANKVRHDAQAHGRMAKTDRIDTLVIWDYADNFQVKADELMDADTTALGAILQRRSQLVDARVAEANRLELATGVALRDIKAHIKQLDKRVQKMDDARAELLGHAPALAARVQRLAAIRGIGPLTAAMLVAFLPELGQASHAEIAALAGIAPWARDSGSMHGHRSIGGGRSHLRRALYMPTLAAIQHKEGDLGRFYTRLRDRGRPGKVAVVAAMRKLLVMANAVAKRDTPWQEQWTAADAARAKAAATGKTTAAADAATVDGEAAMTEGAAATTADGQATTTAAAGKAMVTDVAAVDGQATATQAKATAKATPTQPTGKRQGANRLAKAA